MDNQYHFFQIKDLKTILIILLVLVWSCKQTPKAEKPLVEEGKQETKDAQKLSPIARHLASFAGLTVSDTSKLDQSVIFKKINENGDVESIDLKTYLAIYKIVVNGNQKIALPIFEIRNSDKTIISSGGAGFTGAIWANMLVDRKTQKIVKIQFDHKGESEGYGAQMTQTSFEDRFAGTEIGRKTNTFGFNNGGQDILGGNRMIDGISGATTTSRAAIDMINEALKRYEEYLSQN